MRFSLTTLWVVAAPIPRIFETLTRPEDWPGWWRYVESVQPLRAGDAAGIGAIRRYVWTSRLPYRVRFDMETTSISEPDAIEGVARGELSGIGRWHLTESSRGTVVRYTWEVATVKKWMSALAPLLAPVFAWNHDQVMAEGGRGLARHLGVPLLANIPSRRHDDAHAPLPR